MVELVALVVALVVLLALNGFFVLAEFAIVRVRPSKVAELAATGNPRAVALSHIQEKMDDYLGVCQVGITLASIALGMVSKKGTDVILGPGHDGLRYFLTIAASYVIVSGGHIVLGEQVPKFVGIRLAERSALASVPLLRMFRLLLAPALWLLTGITNWILRLLKVHQTGEEMTEDELRIILDQSQERGLMSFRRLIFFENVFDFGALAVRDAMRSRATVRCLDVDATWDENLSIVKSSRFTRYPLLENGRPIGFVHLKDVVMRGDAVPELRALARPLLTALDTASLESLLVEMQRRRIHAAIVRSKEGQWTGFITLEDVIEELVGTIRDEFEDEEPVRLADALTIDRIVLDVEAESPMAAVRSSLTRLPPGTVPAPIQLFFGKNSRERLAATYLGLGIGMPHARVRDLARPFLMILRSDTGIAFEGVQEKARLLFVLLTPLGQPRVHQRLQGIIATLLHESEYVKERLLTAEAPTEILEVIRTGEQAVLD